MLNLSKFAKQDEPINLAEKELSSQIEVKEMVKCLEHSIYITYKR